MSDKCLNHIEHYWKELTNASNELFHQGDFEPALKGYYDALYKAEVFNNHIDHCMHLKIPFLQLYIISCNNIAMVYEQMGKMTEAQTMLKRVVYYLLHVLTNSKANTNEVHAELKKATYVYLNFMHTNVKDEKEHAEFLAHLVGDMVKG